MQVTNITPKGHQWSVKSSRGSQTYKAVVLAAPFHQTSISVPQSISEQIPPQPYVNLHVTLLTTTSPSPNASYFGLPEGTAAARSILTSRANARNGGKEPEFNSLSYLRKVRDGEWAVKIFSTSPPSDEWLNEMFSGNVGWLYRKVVRRTSHACSCLSLTLLPFIVTFKFNTVASLSEAAPYLHIPSGET